MIQIVFSRDRAMQLDAFLRSYEHFVSPSKELDVLYVASTERHAAAYQQVFARHLLATGYAQKDFRSDLLELVPRSGFVILYADDHLFLRPWTIAEYEINLHLGLNLTYCYTRNVSQPVPQHELVEPDMLTWRWGAGVLDWGYPLAACGQVFSAPTLHQMLSCVHFHSPNSLEAALQVFAPSFWDRQGLCYRESKLVLLPWNLVQTDCMNRAASALPTVDQLLERWEEGMQIQTEPLYGTLNSSLHEELPLLLEAR